jgi:hypothetical protein
LANVSGISDNGRVRLEAAAAVGTGDFLKSTHTCRASFIGNGWDKIKSGRRSWRY